MSSAARGPYPQRPSPPKKRKANTQRSDKKTVTAEDQPLLKLTIQPLQPIDKGPFALKQRGERLFGGRRQKKRFFADFDFKCPPARPCAKALRRTEKAVDTFITVFFSKYKRRGAVETAFKAKRQPKPRRSLRERFERSPTKIDENRTAPRIEWPQKLQTVTELDWPKSLLRSSAVCPALSTAARLKDKTKPQRSPRERRCVRLKNLQAGNWPPAARQRKPAFPAADPRPERQNSVFFST